MGKTCQIEFLCGGEDPARSSKSDQARRIMIEKPLRFLVLDDHGHAAKIAKALKDKDVLCKKRRKLLEAARTIPSLEVNGQKIVSMTEDHLEEVELEHVHTALQAY